ncbi:MAG: helix-turn-helix domain-containing protein [Candidatus Omnitrophica bacterium]|nr:helix-turn-helix domain-containing protein [Candidatus Omnitrophota bacterium]MDD5310758.1 helix-turn-helix domain-containing protein [Candidatus Omnitrophota bacterium]MDD5545559.1 helix-turn-helix domain-containing protein [Candidatus Omnitrophota bacterium]
MSGSHRNELNKAFNAPAEQEKLISLHDAADILELSEEELRRFVAEGKIPAYRIGGEYLRFRKSQVEALRSRIRILKHQSVPILDIRPAQREEKKAGYSIFDRIRDFVYFNDFYILAFILIVLLVAFILLRR